MVGTPFVKLTSLIRKYQSQSNSGLLAGLSYIFSIPQQFPEPPKGDPSSFLIECQQRFQIINMMLEGAQRLPEIVLVGVVFSALLRHPFYRNLVAQYNSSSISDLSFESLSAQINSHFETNNAGRSGRSANRDTARQLRSTESKQQAKEHKRQLNRLEHKNKSLAGKLASARKMHSSGGNSNRSQDQPGGNHPPINEHLKGDCKFCPKGIKQHPANKCFYNPVSPGRRWCNICDRFCSHFTSQHDADYHKRKQGQQQGGGGKRQANTVWRSQPDGPQLKDDDDSDTDSHTQSFSYD